MKISVILLALVACAAGLSAQPLPLSTPENEGLSSTRLDAMHRIVREHTDAQKYAGAVSLVVRHGKIVDWQAYGYRDLDAKLPMEKDTIFRIYSMTKMITAVAVLQLFEEGKLTLWDHVEKWIPELNDRQVFVGGTADHPVLEPAKTPMTVKMLLNHTSGLTYNIFHDSPVQELYQRADLWTAPTAEDFIKRVVPLPLLVQPGTAFNYSISDDVLGRIVEIVSGEKFDAYCAKHIFEPLGMKDTGFDVPAEKMSRLAKVYERGPDGNFRQAKASLAASAEAGQGFPSGGGGGFSTPGDYARFVQALLNGGELDGKRILGRKTIELALTNSLNDLARPTTPANASDGWGLISGVRIDLAKGNEPISVGAFFWSGAASTTFLGDPKEKMISMLFLQHFPYDEHALFARFRTVVYQALVD